ncbi:MAG TPA: hypothetical protein VFA94_02525 [Acidimicrobiales bacterium]|nr:hypothetical protein [Acidimicrobiales bacterium]
MRKFFTIAALSAGMLAIAPLGAHADTVPGGVEGCVATNPGQTSPTGVVYAGTCSYTATRTAGYATAAQGWSVTIYNNNTPQKTVVASYSSAAGSKPCNTSELIKPGQFVVVTVSNGVATAGNPFPSATDGQLHPSDGCASA